MINPLNNCESRMEINLEYRPALHKLSKNYHLKEVLGKGVEGTVLKATDTNTGRDVAIKHIKIEHIRFYSLKKIIRELHIMRELS